MMEAIWQMEAQKKDVFDYLTSLSTCLYGVVAVNQAPPNSTLPELLPPSAPATAIPAQPLYMASSDELSHQRGP